MTHSVSNVLQKQMLTNQLVTHKVKKRKPIGVKGDQK